MNKNQIMWVKIPDYKEISVNAQKGGFSITDGNKQIFCTFKYYDPNATIKDNFLLYLSLASDYKESRDEYIEYSAFLPRNEAIQEWKESCGAHNKLSDLGWTENDINTVYDYILREVMLKTEKTRKVIKTNV